MTKICYSWSGTLEWTQVTTTAPIAFKIQVVNYEENMTLTPRQVWMGIWDDGTDRRQTTSCNMCRKYVTFSKTCLDEHMGRWRWPSSDY